MLGAGSKRVHAFAGCGGPTSELPVTGKKKIGGQAKKLGMSRGQYYRTTGVRIKKIGGLRELVRDECAGRVTPQ